MPGERKKKNRRIRNPRKRKKSQSKRDQNEDEGAMSVTCTSNYNLERFGSCGVWTKGDGELLCWFDMSFVERVPGKGRLGEESKTYEQDLCDRLTWRFHSCCVRHCSWDRYGSDERRGGKEMEMEISESIFFLLGLQDDKIISFQLRFERRLSSSQFAVLQSTGESAGVRSISSSSPLPLTDVRMCDRNRATSIASR